MELLQWHGKGHMSGCINTQIPRAWRKCAQHPRDYVLLMFSML